MVYASYINGETHGNKLMNVEDNTAFGAIEGALVKLIKRPRGYNDAKNGLTGYEIGIARFVFDDIRRHKIMKTTYEEFKVMSLRPAYYNGTQFEADICFDEASAYRVYITEADAANMIRGDTVRISGKIRTDDKTDYEFVTVYMCGDELTEFIEKFGAHKISATVRMKLELVYTAYEETSWNDEHRKEEMIIYKLLGIAEDGGKE